MKKIVIALAVFAALVACASAQMDQCVLSSSSVTTNVSTDSVVLAGEIYSIYIDSPASKTNAVAIKDALDNTVLSIAALTADANYYPVVSRVKNTDGTSATFDTNSVFGSIAVVSELTMTVTPAANTTGTNETKAIITFKK